MSNVQENNSGGLARGLKKSGEGFFSRMVKLLSGRPSVDREILEEMEELLISADAGAETASRIVQALEKHVTGSGPSPKALLRAELLRILGKASPAPASVQRTPHVILVAGVNGVGKTTSIGKLSYWYAQRGKKVVLGAADTFRAAAAEQIKIWGERTGAEVISHKMGADPASVAFDALTAAVARKADVAIIDTAGRLHNKKHLMEELAKVRRVMQRVVPDAPHEVLLVLDAASGQNAVEQAKQFSEIISVTGIILAKMDGTAKGGIVLAIADQLGIPVRYIGTGEQAADLAVFDREIFVNTLLEEPSHAG